MGGGGGHPGVVGRDVLRPADGTEEDLPSKGTWHLRRGDRICIETQVAAVGKARHIPPLDVPLPGPPAPPNLRTTDG